MKVADLIQKYSNEFSNIYSHPFNEKLNDGNLEKTDFIAFLEQDWLYLLDFAKALNKLEARLTNQRHALHFKSFSEDTVSFELEIQQKYLNGQTQTLEKKGAIREYSEHLCSSASDASIEEAVVSFIPCFWIYKELGEQMKQAGTNPEHPYQEWIASYLDEKFKESTRLIIEIADELIEEIICPHHQAKIRASFLKSIHYEHQFFEEILPSEQLAFSMSF